MIEVKTYQHTRDHHRIYTLAEYSRYDPTRTTSLRNTFARAMRVRFKKVMKEIKKVVNEDDVFGLKEQPAVYQSPGYRAYQFLTTEEKIAEFMNWLRQLIKKDILEIGTMEQIGYPLHGAWTDLYVLEAYKRGIARSRLEMKKAGYDIPSLEETGGIGASMRTPFHLDRVGILYTRVFTDLIGVTDAMANQISRVLAEGMIMGDGARVIAKKLVATIEGTGIGKLGITDTLGRFIPAMRRAEMIARTELIRAFHMANVQEMRNWGAVGVRVQAEFLTAGDDRVCDICASLEGKIYTLDEIEPIIPLHPNCRCLALPVLERDVKQKE